MIKKIGMIGAALATVAGATVAAVPAQAQYYGRSYDRGYSDRGYYNNGRYNDRYNGRYGYDRDTGSFTCWIDRGRVSRMDYSGIRGM